MLIEEYRENTIMTVNISWYAKNRVILAQVEGVVDDAGMNASNATITQLLDTGQAPIHLIVDTSDLKQFPTNLSALRKSQAYLLHPNVGWIIVINTNPLLNYLAHILTAIAKVKSRTVKTFVEGEQLLRTLDASITV
jgi:hypothetical protein